jgi:hypothetical protein
MPPVDGLRGGYSFGETTASSLTLMSFMMPVRALTIEGGGLEFSVDVDGAPIARIRRADVACRSPTKSVLAAQASLAKYGFEFLIPLEPRRRWPRDARLAF